MLPNQGVNKLLIDVIRLYKLLHAQMRVHPCIFLVSLRRPYQNNLPNNPKKRARRRRKKCLCWI